MDMYNNSNSQEKIFNFQKTNDLKVLISTIRLTTTISKNSINVSKMCSIYFVVFITFHYFCTCYY